MKNSFIIKLILIFIFFQNILNAEIFNIESSEIKIKDKGNITEATNGVRVSSNDEIEIIGQNLIYDKNKSILNNYVQELKYGTVAINEWPALGFIIPTMPWGGYPGNKDSDIQSGQGYVHNAYFFESPLKGVLYSNFKLPLIDPVWFTSNKKKTYNNKCFIKHSFIQK